jgi:hypothetical protein
MLHRPVERTLLSVSAKTRLVFPVNAEGWGETPRTGGIWGPTLLQGYTILIVPSSPSGANQSARSISDAGSLYLGCEPLPVCALVVLK